MSKPTAKPKKASSQRVGKTARSPRARAATKSTPATKRGAAAKAAPAKRTPPSKSSRAAGTVVRIQIPAALRKQLGDDPADTIARLLAVYAEREEVLALREILSAERNELEELRGNPFRAVVLDNTTRYTPFENTRIPGPLERKRYTQAELVAEALDIAKVPLAQLMLTGLLREAADVVKTDYRRQQIIAAAAHGNPNARKQRVSGMRDNDLIAAVEQLRATNSYVSASALRRLTGIASKSAQFFLTRRAHEFNLRPTTDSKMPRYEFIEFINGANQSAAAADAASLTTATPLKANTASETKRRTQS